MTPQLNDLLMDTALVEFVEEARASIGPTWRELGPYAVRELQQERIARRPPGLPGVAVADMSIADGLAVRLYLPESATGMALLVYLHGGMWTIGNLDSHDRLCRRLVREVGVAVLAVHYRRAPECPWPAAVDDAVAAVQWAQTRVAELTRGGVLMVAGDSAGGHLATLACLRLRDAGGPLPAAQILVCPNTDLTLSLPSAQEKRTGWGLTTDDIAWGAELWMPDPRLRADPRVSPLFEPDLSGLPPALIVTAEHDPLRDEGEAYAHRLMDAGVPTLLRREAKMIHGFLTLDTLSPAADAAGERLFGDISQMNIRPDSAM
ncbi:alpha/beta hydrolase [Actinomadura xylanilytica]|uniref:alpha/beta hydrolase n=1 Tax=Actinomadura xylanilytica TaxID=887459 RepID=UPI00255AC04E|nr:alpha/beta hydrolase [Actinomadura xylanilytica]MDL4774191.1 alpha/beta hydrolase [Actinomadura xylanilytica]